jgi:cytochrome c
MLAGVRARPLLSLPLSAGGKKKLRRALIANVVFSIVLLLFSLPAHAQLRGHGGPVRALAVSTDGEHAVSGSFDTSAIRWSLTRNVAEQVLRFHDAAVNAVAMLPDGRAVTAGADGKIAVWTPGNALPLPSQELPFRRMAS